MVKVIKDFRDKKTNDVHVIGSEYEGSAARVKELQKLGYLEAEAEKKDEGKGQQQKDGE